MQLGVVPQYANATTEMTTWQERISNRKHTSGKLLSQLEKFVDNKHPIVINIIYKTVDWKTWRNDFRPGLLKVKNEPLSLGPS